MTIRVIFAGTPEFAKVSLAALHQQQDVEIVAVYTQPDRPKGRGQQLQPSSVKAFALEHNYLVEQPLSLKQTDVQEKLASYQADIMVVVAYGLLLPEAVLQTPKKGCINVHGSLLPRWRGAAPIQRAIEAGDAETGVCIMQMDKGLDTGPVFASASLAIDEQVTSMQLHDQLAELGGRLLADSITSIVSGEIQAAAQQQMGELYAHKLKKTEARINWQQPAAVIQRKIRAFQPWPVAYTMWQKQPLRLWQAEVVDDASNNSKNDDAQPGEILETNGQGITVATGLGCLRIIMLQPPSKAKMLAKDFANGRALLGMQFG